MPKVFSSLRVRIVLLITIPFAVMLGMIVYHTLGEREEHIADAKARVAGTAQMLAIEQQRIIDHTHQLLLSLALLPEVRRGVASPDCVRTLMEWHKLEPGLNNIFVAVPEGKVICSAVATAQPVNVADREFVQRALRTHEFSTGDYIINRATGKPGIGVAYSVVDDLGRPAVVVGANINALFLAKGLANASLPEGSRMTIVDGQGTILARIPDPEGWVGKVAADDMPLMKTVRSNGGSGIVDERGLDGVTRIYRFQPLYKTNSHFVTLWVGIPKEAIVGPVQRQFVLSMLVALALLVLTFVVFWLGSEQLFLRRIAALGKAVTKLGHGEFATRSGLPPGSDEIARLAQAFDGMAEALETKENQLTQANRALRVVSAGNRTMLRAKDEPQLMEEMCRAIVEAGGYRSAWVGYAESNSEKGIRPIAQWGAIAEGFFKNAKLTWSEAESGRTPAGTAIRTGIPVTIQDIQNEAGVEPWRQYALRGGCGSCIALPLRIAESVIGVLEVCAGETGAFGNEEVRLLAEAAADLSYGIAAVRGIAEQAPLRAALRTVEERLRAAAEASLDALFILKSVRDQENNIVDFEFTDINKGGEQLIGMARNKVIGQKLCELLPVNRTGVFFDKYVRVLNTGVPLEEEFPIDTPETKAKWLRHQVVRVGDGIAISSRDITVWKAVSAQLRESEQSYRTLADSSPALIWASGADKQCNYFNQPWLKFTGRTLEQELGNGWAEGVHPDDLTQCLATYTEAFDRREPFSLEYRLRRHDGEFRWVRDDGCPRHDSNGEFIGYLGYVMDITARKQDEQALERANRALRTLSACNEALVRAGNEVELLDAICRLIVETGGYNMAWVGFAEQDAEKTVRPVAQYGHEEGYLAAAKISWADTELGHGPAGTAIRTGAVQVNMNFLTNPALAPWREEAQQRGYQSSIALPLKTSAGILGALTIYAREPDAFNESEVTLLRELAEDTAFGITTQRVHIELERTELVNMARLRLLQFAPAHTLDELLEATLDEAEKLSGSLVGFYHFLDDDQKTLWPQNWSTRTKAEFCTAEGKGSHYEVSAAGVWADCIRERRAVIHNDYASLSHRKGMPEGHAQIFRELVVPVFRGEAIVAILGVGNKPRDYTPQDVEVVSLLADLAWEIAERKRAEEQLRVASLYTRSLIEASLDPLVTISAEGKITDVNDATEKATGRSRSELIGTDFSDYFTEPDKAREGYQQVFLNGSVTDYPLVLRHRDGHITEVLYNASIYRDTAGGVSGVFAAARDVTERNKAEQEVVQLGLQNKLILDAAGEGIYGMDMDGKCTFVNPAAMQLFGFRAEELIGRHCHSRFHHTKADGSPYPAEECPVQAVYRQGKVHRGEDLYWRKDGSVFPVEFISTPILEAGEITGAVVMFSDITERKQAEQALERANRALRTLSACNEALVHAGNEVELLDAICRLIVETGGYRMVWVGFPEQDSEQTVRPVARFGHDEGFLAEAKISWADTEFGRGPTGTAIRTGAVQVNQNVLTNHAAAPWRDAAKQRGYQSSIALPLKSSVGILGSLTLYASERDAFNETEVALLQELAEDLAFGIEILRTRAERDRIAFKQRHHEEILRRSLEQSIQAIADTVETRDPYTAGHQRRVAELATAIAQEMGLAEERVHGMHLAASIHDLGKIQVPAEILSKPGKLTDIEFMLIREHAQAGYDILKGIEFPWSIADIVRQHHERLDGSGYPQGLKDGQILLESRILTVADVVEAMSSHRPYRPGLGVDAALEEIERHRDVKYDPKAVDACIKLFHGRGYKFSA